MINNNNSHSSEMDRRIYPQCCTSAFCGGGEDCKTCRHKEVKEEFDQWVKDRDAYNPEPIWCPLVYVAQK